MGITDGTLRCSLCGEWQTGCMLCGEAPMREATPQEMAREAEEERRRKERMKPLPNWIFYH